jgi:hypothetical protein
VQCWNLLGFFLFFPLQRRPNPNTTQTVKLERDECLCAFLFPVCTFILFIYFSA